MNATIFNSSEMFNLIVEQAGMEVYLVHPDGALMYVNKAAADSLGYTVEEMYAMGVPDFDVSAQYNTKENFRKHFEALKINDMPSFETQHRAKDGSIRTKEIKSTYLRMGKQEFVCGIGHDITEKKRAEEELRFKNLLLSTQQESSIDGILVVGKDNQILSYNSKFVSMWGIPPEIIATKSDELALKSVISKLVDPAQFLEKVMYLYQHKDEVSFDEIHITDGSVFERYSAPLISKEGIYYGRIWNFRDISERQRTQAQLKKAEKLLKAAIQQSTAGILVAAAPDVRIEVANAAALGIRGDDAKSLVDIPVELHPLRWQTFWPNGSPVAPEDLPLSRAILKGESSDNVEVIIRRTDGEDRWVLASATPIRDDAGEVIAGIVVFPDITDRKKAEIALAESEEKYRSFLEETREGITLIDEEGKIILWNKALEQLSGIKACNAIGAYYWDIIFKELPAERKSPERYLQLKTMIEKALQTGTASFTGSREVKTIKSDGTTAYSIQSVFSIKTARGFRFGSIAHDITDKKSVEDALTAEKERLSVTLRSIGDGVITTDTSGIVVIMNKVAEEFTGWKQDEAAGKQLADIFHIINELSQQRCENPVTKVLATGKTIELANHTVLISKDGTRRTIADSAAPIRDKTGTIIGVVLVFRDMTEKLRLLEASINNQKLEALGVLAGGIAHDFNNLLGGIFGYIDLANAKNTDKKVADFLERAGSTISRARGLTQQLLTFSKGGTPVKTTGHLFPFIQETVQFALSGSAISCHFTIADNLTPSSFDRNQIGQVIDNIIINAQQAMPLGGSIEITARNISLAAGEHPVLPPGMYAKIIIRDSGIGMPREILSRIFDPFFTTKATGHGLGLATCYSIINRHNGAIDVDSEPGKGTAFTIYLPASSEIIDHAKPEKPVIVSGSGTFLIMDDEAVIRDILASMLEQLGYTTVLTANGREALDYFMQEHSAKRPLAGIVVDLTIPGGLGGKDVVADIRRYDKEIPVIVSSGYAEDPVMASPQDYGFTASLKKPFKLEELSSLIYGIKHYI